jgi:hypothetical protein
MNKAQQPPNETRWKKGCSSPNPKGRPSKAEGLEVLDEILAREDPVSRKTAWRQLWEIAVRRAKQGSTKHFDFIMSYKLGKPKQSIEATALGSIPVEIVTNVQIPSK